MSISRNKLVLLLLVLLQGLVSFGATQRTVFLSHRADCSGHPHPSHHAHDHAPPATPSHTHASHSCDAHAPAAAIDCCPCPHIHVRLLDGPLTRDDSRGVKETLPKPVRLTWLEPAIEPLAMMRRSPRAPRLDAEHPPPDGLRTTILVI